MARVERKSTSETSRTWECTNPSKLRAANPSRIFQVRGFRGAMPQKINIQTVLTDRPPLRRGMVIATPRARNLRGLAEARAQLIEAGYTSSDIARVAFCAAPGRVVSINKPASLARVGEPLIERHRQDWLAVE